MKISVLITGVPFQCAARGGVGGGASDLEDAGGFGDGLAVGDEVSEGGELGRAGGIGLSTTSTLGQR
jgi:hypothetical protein